MFRCHKKKGLARAAEHVQDSIRSAEQPLKEHAKHTNESLMHSADCARDSALHSGRYAKQTVKDHPGFTIAGVVMLLFGVIVGLVVAQFTPTFARYLKMRSM